MTQEQGEPPAATEPPAGPIRTVILDVDGTLVDSNDAHARAWVQAGADFGYRVRFEDVRPLIGMGGDRVLPALTGLSEEEDEGRRLVDHRGDVFRRDHLPTVRGFPAARELVARIRLEGMKPVVASSASEEDLALLLERAGVEDLVEAATSSDDAESSKPAPDIVRAALERSGCAATEAVMIGDTPYDVAACERAGIAIIGLRCGGWDQGALAGAAAVYDDPADLLRHWDASPLGWRTPARG